MKTKFSGILTLLLAFVVQLSFAQEKTISGTISDETGLPLPGVNIVVKGTSNGTQTDFDGNYSISTSTGSVLTYTFVGYKTVTKTVGSASAISFGMEIDAQAIEEVVIEGAYDIKRTKPTTTTAIQTVSAETIDTRPNASLVQTLQGQAAGLNITTNSGQPGGDSEINLRGVGSITGKTEPLFIMDGIPIDEDNFRSLNPSEIASVSVLKDAGATAIYGNRGANGVIIITTKRGKYNSNFEVNYTGITSVANLQGNDYDLMNSTEQLQLERNFGTGRGVGLSDAEIAAIANYADTEWEDVFFREALTQNHTLSITAGGENVNSFTSFGYFDQKGVLVQSSLKRFNIRNNTNGKSKNDKFNYSTSLSLNFSKNEEPNNIGSGAVNRNYILGAYQSLPYISPDEYVVGEGGSLPPSFVLTPLLLLDRLATYERSENEIKILGSVSANYKLTPNLTIGTRIGADFTEEQRLAAEGPNSFNSVFFAGVGETLPGTVDQQMTRTISIDVVNSLTYSKTFAEKHTLDAGIYMEYYKSHLRAFGFRQLGLDPKTYYAGDGSGFVPDNGNNDFYVDTANAAYNNAGLFSYFANADYDYNKKYGLGVTFRRDASYRFSDTNRWGTFYAVSGRWNIDQESFMENSGFSLLKLRASYGTTGNQDINAVNGQFADFSANSLGLNLYASGNGYANINSITQAQIANPDLKWETTAQTNIGLDWEVINRRFRGSLDVYHRKATDVFQFQPTASYTGTTGLFVNSGELINKGVDLQLNYDLLKNPEGLNATVNFVGNYNKSERYGAQDSTIEEGGKIGQYYTIRYAGVNPANGNLLFLDKDGNLTENPDANDDRVFTDKNRYADFQGSFGFELDYKGFYLSTQFNYVVGADRYDFDYSGFIDPTSIGNFRSSRDILRAWTPDNRVTDIPSLNASNLDVDSDRFIQSADYLRLRFVSFGYNFSRETLESLKISKLRLFANAENMVTFTGWRGNDAEGFGSTQNNYPTPRIVSVGLELGL
ncbi:SusC/RagA family TonB-linked outer membrane protein [Lacinutrix sp. 5H-3-7-4]|uniref:SusC/RagA family TonB-linked outer membrane protein n=1 Tax=Lacinutrix sp. (strain 5H-3-7-4) TaxID=983544 RepID=UPI00020A364C|nr:SusC/RagA family TonB-linked outer membrane protein [Lacinutrix sp. 5H-3-7-4]AEH00273.1 TonB-dependent receptor plug [Lacinutrix sp. 5H-3-7-4]